jgi:stage III sporulation protein AF
VGLDYDALSLALTENRGNFAGYSAQEASNLSAQMMKTIIAEQTGAYILDKATALGAECAVEVVCEVGDENLPYPVAVTVTGKLTGSQREALTREIEADLAIPAEMQTFESGDVE